MILLLRYFFFLFLFTMLFSSDEIVSNDIQEDELILLDSIAVLRIGSSGLAPTYYSDAWFLSPFGLTKNLEEIVIQNIWMAYGNEHGIKMTSDGAANEYAEQYFDMLQEQRGVSRKQIESMAKEFGYTIEDVKKELNNKYLVEQTVETFFAASGKLNISNDEIAEFYSSFPRYEEPSFIIETGSLTVDGSLKIDMENPDIINKIEWSNKPYEVLKKDLNDDFLHIDDCKIGDIVYYEYFKNKKSFLCYRLVEKKKLRQLSFNELYEEITKQLQAIKYEEGYKILTTEFLSSSKIIYQDPKLKKQCIDSLKK
jgi:hypothetical protein